MKEYKKKVSVINREKLGVKDHLSSAGLGPLRLSYAGRISFHASRAEKRAPKENPTDTPGANNPHL